jgi:glycosyltransferase involved in cell wall biosynthesis
MRLASDELGAVRLSMVGRNSEIRGTELREELKGKQVEVVIHGLLKPEDVVKVLTESDVMLFVRGPISTRRGSALAGIACGLPVVAWDGWETAGPILEAGVVLLPDQRDDAFGPGLVRVLKDRTYRESLSQRSRQAQSRYFSWDAIAAEYAAKLRDE